MNPFFFGDSRRHLFGVYQPSAERSTRAAVVCYPWAREYLLAHPTLRLLSARLAGQGWHTLRFDYAGTGDSAGGSDDASQRQWLTDVETAIDEVKDVSQASQVALIGLRYGATLAALSAAHRPEVAKLVLWDPVVEGRTYLTELGAAATNGRPAGPQDVQGAVLTDRMRAELEQVGLSSFGPKLPPTLIVSTTPDSTPAERLATHLRGGGVECAMEIVPELQVWREEWGRGGKGLGVQVVSRIVAWLD